MIEVKKVSKILNEMVSFSLNREATKVDSSIENKEDLYKLTIQASNLKCNNDCINNLKQLLNAPRQKDVEEYYWELTGESDTGAELELVGMMVDKAIVEFDKGNLYIELHRLK